MEFFLRQNFLLCPLFFREMNEDTCQKKNMYEADHDRVLDEFWEKYGLFGEGLQTPEEKNDKTGSRIHFPDVLL